MRLPLLLALLSVGCWGDEAASVAGEEFDAPELAKLLLKEREGRIPEEIIREIELLPQKSYEDLMDLALAHLWTSQYHAAAQEYEIAAREAGTVDQLAGALYGKATAAGYTDLEAALSAADLLVRVQPDSVEAAWLRLGLYRHSGDELGLIVARDHVLRVDSEASGHEVLEPLTVGLVVAGGVAIASIVGTTAVVALTPPEDRAEVALAAVKGITAIGVGAVDSLDFMGSLGQGSPDVGHLILEAK